MSAPLLLVDAHVVEALSHLTRRGLERLRFHLSRCATPNGKPVTIQFTSVDLREGAGITKLRLTMPAKGGGRLDSSITYDTGVEWSNSTLRIWGAHLPETMKMYGAGMRLGDVVAGAPFPDEIVQKVASINGGISVRCRGVAKAPLDPDAIVAHDGDNAMLLQATRLIGILVEPFTAEVLTSMNRMQAIHLLVHLSQRESAQVEHVPVAYRRSAGQGTLMKVGPDDHHDAIRMQLLKTGLSATMWVGEGPDRMGVAEGHVFRRASLLWENDTPSSVLGMEMRGAFGSAIRSTGSEIVGQIMKGHRIVGDVLGI